jgi:hypothetical protein
MAPEAAELALAGAFRHLAAALAHGGSNGGGGGSSGSGGSGSKQEAGTVAAAAAGLQEAAHKFAQVCVCCCCCTRDATRDLTRCSEQCLHNHNLKPQNVNPRRRTCSICNEHNEQPRHNPTRPAPPPPTPKHTQTVPGAGVAGQSVCAGGRAAAGAGQAGA